MAVRRGIVACVQRMRSKLRPVQPWSIRTGTRPAHVSRSAKPASRQPGRLDGPEAAIEFLTLVRLEDAAARIDAIYVRIPNRTAQDLETFSEVQSRPTMARVRAADGRSRRRTLRVNALGQARHLGRFRHGKSVRDVRAGQPFKVRRQVPTLRGDLRPHEDSCGSCGRPVCVTAVT